MDTNSKFFLKSKTVIGLLIMILPTVASVFGYDINKEAADHAGELLTSTLTGNLDSIIELLGFTLSSYGTLKRTKKLTLTPDKK